MRAVIQRAIYSPVLMTEFAKGKICLLLFLAIVYFIKQPVLCKNKISIKHTLTFYVPAKWFVKSGFVITFKMFCAVTISQVSYAGAGEMSKVFTIGLKCYTVNHGLKHHRSPHTINR